MAGPNAVITTYPKGLYNLTLLDIRTILYAHEVTKLYFLENIL